MTADAERGHPIRRWKLANFKSVEEADLELAPLTVLVGANSSGKSTLLQSMLLIAQATQEGTSAWLPLNGPLVELGDVQDVIFAGKASAGEERRMAKGPSQFRIGAEFDLTVPGRPSFRLPPPLRGQQVNGCAMWEAAFGALPRDRGIGAAGLASASLTMDLGGGQGIWSFNTSGTRRKELGIVPGTRTVSLQGEVLPLRGVLNQQLHRGGRPSHLSFWPVEGPPEARRTAGLVQIAGIPIQFLYEVDRVQYETQEILERLERESFLRAAPERAEDDKELSRQELEKIKTKVAHAVITQLQGAPAERARPSRTLSPEDLRLVGRLTSHQKKAIFSSVQRTVQKLVSKGETVLGLMERRHGLSAGLEWVGFSISKFMSQSVRYLGPLREDPRVVYLPTPGEHEGKVGRKGEKAVALLHAHASDQIECFHPDGKTGSCTLAEGVKDWLHFFEIAEAIDTELRPRLGLEPHLNLPDVDRRLDMTAVGVGVSQIFPVLVMGLHSPPGSVLLMEQPELHLHPALQQRLGDFLLACALNGRQLIVETHSDHLISRLRRRIAEDETNQLQKSLAVIFAERNQGRTSYRRVEVNRFGGIDEWPQGFFDQAAKESQLLLRAGLAKKKLETESSQ